MQIVQRGKAGPPTAPDEPLQLVGRLRRWHRSHSWGFIFSEFHNCDVFLDGANEKASSSLSEGDLVLFEVWTSEGKLEAHNVRGADPEEVEEKQALLAPVYQRRAAHVPQASDLSRSTNGQAATVSSSSSARAPRDGLLATIPKNDGGSTAVPSSAPFPQALQRPPPPPPPPPPTHPMPTGPGGFPQALGNAGGLIHPPPYMAQLSHGNYPAYNNERGLVPTGMYQHGHWQNGDTMRSPGALDHMANQSHGARLLLEPPHHLQKLDPQAVLAVLRGGPWSGQRGKKFERPRNGCATQIGQEWCEAVRQARNTAEEHAGGVHQQWPLQAQAEMQQWTWGATSTSGDPGLYATTSAS